MAKQTFVRVGQIVGAHGLKGQVKVELLTSFVDRFQQGARLRLRGEWVEIKAAQLHQNRLLLRLVGVDNRDAAEALQWEYLEGKPEEVELEEDEYVTDDLLGLEVVTIDGKSLGVVDEILPMPAQDVLVVGQIMIPTVKQFVREIDLDQGKITVELIPGMLPE